LETAKALILEMQAAKIPPKLIIEALKDRYSTQFHVLTHAIEVLKQSDRGMKKGWEKLQLPVISEEHVETAPQNVQINGELAPASVALAVLQHQLA
jgi:hypothetical protein